MSLIESALHEFDLQVICPDGARTGIQGRLELAPEQLRPVCRALNGYGFFLETVTAVDHLAEGTIQGVWFFNHYRQAARLQIIVVTDRRRPVFPSIGSIYPGAVWHERETGEFFGIRYADARDSRSLLLPEEMAGHPLRKDFNKESA